MIETVVTIGQDAWTVTGDDQPNALAPTPRITTTVHGVTVDLNCQYRQITSTTHADGCTWGVHMNPICTCAPRPKDQAGVDALFAAAVSVLRKCCAAREAAQAAEDAARLATVDADTVYVRLPAGCDGCPSAMYGGTCTCC